MAAIVAIVVGTNARNRATDDRTRRLATAAIAIAAAQIVVSIVSGVSVAWHVLD